jgi:hypothetical protein
MSAATRRRVSSAGSLSVAGIGTALMVGPGKLTANGFKHHHHLATLFQDPLAKVLAASPVSWCALLVALWAALFVSWTWAA